MTRLYDRVMTYGCEPLSAAQVDIASSVRPEYVEEYRKSVRSTIQSEKGVTLTDSQIDAITERSRRGMEKHKASETIDPGVDAAVVVSAEECAEYCAALPDGTNIRDLVASVVPPFDSLFVEFQGRPNMFDCRSWGVLFIPDRRDDGWLVLAELVAEWDRRRPIGPLVRLLIPLDKQGMMRPADPDGYGSMFIHPFEVPTVPEDAMRDYFDSYASLLAPALFAISLMHCKNVDAREVEPPERMSRNHAKKHGRPLTKYYVLDIRAMRSVLDREGDAQASGLRHALHICRGHFKTYGSDAPLLGKHEGTYWWPAHVRGNAEEGTVEKDYRVRLDDGPAESFEEGLGRDYVEADEHPEITPTAEEHTGRDPDLGGRGLRAHNVTQNLLARAVRDAGYVPRGPRPDEPQFDLAWEAGDEVWVAEVKSVTPQNEERQLRTALGQVLRYRQQLAVEGRAVRALVATETEPSDASWAALMAAEGIALVWAPDKLTVE